YLVAVTGLTCFFLALPFEWIPFVGTPFSHKRSSAALAASQLPSDVLRSILSPNIRVPNDAKQVETDAFAQVGNRLGWLNASGKSYWMQLFWRQIHINEQPSFGIALSIPKSNYTQWPLRPVDNVASNFQGGKSVTFGWKKLGFPIRTANPL